MPLPTSPKETTHAREALASATRGSQHGCLHIEAGNDGVDVGPLCEEKIYHLEPVVNAREAQRLAEDVRARPRTPEDAVEQGLKGVDDVEADGGLEHDVARGCTYGAASVATGLRRSSRKLREWPPFY